jgi:acetamidase/formamidase
MTTEMDLDLVADVPVDTIHATTPSGRITFGFSSDLNQAAIAALDAMLAWMQRLLGLQKVEALALASVVVDLRVTQVANEVWGVHAVLPHDALG